MRKTPLRKKLKICKKCQQLKYLWAKGMCLGCASAEKEREKRREKSFEEVGKEETLAHPTRPKKTSQKRSKMIEKIDKVFSEYVRKYHADENGFVYCFTSGVKMHWKEAHAGHFKSRNAMGTRWDLRNVWPQSQEENIGLHGNPAVFRQRLVETLGEKEVIDIEQIAHSTIKLSESELENIYENLKTTKHYQVACLGHKQGRLFVKWRHPTQISKVICECDCGLLKTFYLSNILTTENKKNTQSCGCYRRSKEWCPTKIKHKSISSTWFGMRNRCNSETSQAYPQYGGRGISICPEWNDFVVFQEWCISNGWTQGFSIERIDVNGNYGPDNCTFIPQREQAINTRRTITTIGGVTKYNAEWAELIGVGIPCFRKKLLNKESLEILFSKKRVVTKNPQIEELLKADNRTVRYYTNRVYVNYLA